jgi:molybdopterin/thiamine biosynthesis adenylyltransferase
MTEWTASLAGERADYVEALARLGFSQQEDGVLIGSISVPTGSGDRPHTIAVTVPATFPFGPPRAESLDGYGSRSWHHDRDGGLCLYSTEEGEDLPWREPATFLDRIREWFVHDERGWPEDAPDLDLERYFERADGLLIADDVDALIGRPIRAKWSGHKVLTVVGTGTAPRSSRPGYVYGWAADIGEPARPPRDWEDVKALLDSGASSIVRRVETTSVSVLLLRYVRKGHRATLGLIASRASGGVHLTSMETAESTANVVRLRAGNNQDILGDRAVAIVGVGAIGSFVADLLARRGVGRLLLQDDQRLRPGNCIRHLAGLEFVGANKAAAVRDLLDHSGRLPKERIDLVEALLVEPHQALGLLETHDLVVDASAHGATSALLASASQFSGRPMISACLVGGGSIARVDRWPLKEGEEHMPVVDDGAPRTVLREGGCGDPVSPASPVSVVAAAGLAADSAVGLLTDGNVAPTVAITVEPWASRAPAPG